MSAPYEDATLELVAILQKCVCFFYLSFFFQLTCVDRYIIQQAVKNDDDQLERICGVFVEFYGGGQWSSKLVRLGLVTLLETLVYECPNPE